jgi:hypothetical protein
VRRALLLALCVGFQASTASATFDVTSVILGFGGTAAGTSNGVGFTLSPTFIWDQGTVTNDVSLAFSNTAYHNPPLAMSDILHIGLQDFKFTFSQPVSSALIYIFDNGPEVDSTLDFGITPVVVSGDIAVISATAFRPSTLAGGIVRLDNINSIFLNHEATGAEGGLNFAIIVSAVPEPGCVTLLAASSLGLLAFGSRTNR